MEKRGCAEGPAIAVLIGAAPAQPTNIGMLMCSAMSELRGRDHLGIFLKRFRTWVCSNQCDNALDLETTVNTSETPRVKLEILYGIKLAAESFLA